MRLTMRNADGIACSAKPFQISTFDMIDKLADYEDTGLEPEEIEDRQDVCLWIPEDRFTEVINAEADGRLVALPCKVGNTVYRIHTKDHVEKHRVIAFHVSASGLWFWDENGRETPVEAIGKTVFLSRAEAEAALKGELGDV